MFFGEYSHTIDAKGRLAMPAKFRAKLQRGAVVTRGLDNCLFVFSANEWKQFADQVMRAPLTKATSRAFSRFLLAGAVEAEFDKQGRILIPEYLRGHAGLQKKTIVAGLGSRLEIWDEGAWQKYSKVTERNSTSIAEELSELGI
jgi:MraZ protein